MKKSDKLFLNQIRITENLNKCVNTEYCSPSKKICTRIHSAGFLPSPNHSNKRKTVSCLQHYNFAILILNTHSAFLFKACYKPSKYCHHDIKILLKIYSKYLELMFNI